MTIAYAEPPKAPPTSCPCLACGVYGPYCADACALFDAWVAAGRPGPVAAVQSLREEHPNGR